jgi:hypothetical protein
MNKPTPSIGNWYRDIQQGITFEVVAVDDSSRTIETQLIDGAITEYDFENWLEMLVEEIEAPEDWRNAYELSSEDWNGPLSMIETDIVIGIPDDI